MYKLLGRFYGIKKPLHPGLFSGSGIFLDDPLPGRRINFLDHVFKGGFSFAEFLFLGQAHEFLRAAPYRRLYRLVSEPALFALPMPLFSGTDFFCQKLSSYLKSDGRRSCRLHFSHSAIFLTLPFSKTVFILTSPPQEQKNFWVALVVREFLLT
jgi:hypothetical protein